MSWQSKRAFYYLFWFFAGIAAGVLISAITELMIVKGSFSLEDQLYYYMAITIIFGLAGIILAPRGWQAIYVKGKRGKKYVIKGAK